MSSSDSHPRLRASVSAVARRHVLRAACLAAGLVVLAGCGFQPLYGGAHQEIQQDAFSSINIVPIKDRDGQIVHNYLLTKLNPGGEPKFAAYNLQVRLRRSIQSLGIRKDETATRANLIMRANYILTRTDSGERVFTGQAQSANSYNILDSRFATIVSEQDATDRAARELAENIKTRLGIFFSRKGQAAGDAR